MKKQKNTISFAQFRTRTQDHLLSSYKVQQHKQLQSSVLRQSEGNLPSID